MTLPTRVALKEEVEAVPRREGYLVVLTTYLFSLMFIFAVLIQVVLALLNKFGNSDFDILSEESAVLLVVIGSVLAVISIIRSARIINRK